MSSIINDAELKTSFDKIDKAIGANVELRKFKDVISKNNLVLLRVADYENFRKEVWRNYIFEIKDQAKSLVDDYINHKEDISKIITEAKKDLPVWKDIIEKFNLRFYVPFRVEINNIDDVILKQETANFRFSYYDRNDAPVVQQREQLLNILSKGEQRAFFILQFLFEVESRLSNGSTTLLILDDIADSFDYKNKYAIIEYIKDLKERANFRMIILTHNFDFYRTVASRLGLGGNVKMVTKNSDTNEITLNNGQYRKDIFSHYIDRFSERKIFISLITFVRNLIEYSDGENVPEYLTLTSCLHIKPNTHTLTSQDIFDIYQTKINRLAGRVIPFGADLIIETIYNEADLLLNNTQINEIHLENKIVLAIASRLRAEEYMISKLPQAQVNLITTNQTQKLFQLYKDTHANSTNIRLLDKVNLMTPENIHLNSFMFEPLLDMSVYHLQDLYRDVSNMT